MGSYWQRRRARADARLGKSERDVAKRAEAYYREELKGLEKEIAAFYAEFPEGHVEAYREAFKKLSADEERMLWEDCDRFAAEHPDRAWMVPVRKGMYRLTRLEGLQHSARLGLAKATAKTETLLPRHFEEAAREAARAVADALGFDTYDEGAVRRFVGTEWSDGKSYSARIWDNAAKLAEYVCGDMAKALARGESYAKLRDEIARRFVGQSVSNIMRVVQTEGTYVSRQVQGDEMRKAGFDAYYIDSVEDKRTCETCRSISKLSHERPFRFEDAKPGENYPPLHPRCRCEVNPAVDDWADFIKGGNGRPQDRAKVAERFGAAVERGISTKRAARFDAHVDFDLINSREYARAFDDLTGNPKADKALLRCARACLTHRAGTAMEDLHLVSVLDGTVKASQTGSKSELEVDRSKAVIRAVAQEPTDSLFAVHNHPTNVPPTGSDLCASGARRYAGGLVVLHNGSVYYYRHGDLPFGARQFDMVVQSNLKKGMIAVEAYEETLRYFERRYGIQWKRLR